MSELHLFEGIGIELEYMIVDEASLSVRPICDQLLATVGGGYEVEVERGPVAWSNELALHVVELKLNGPAPSLDGTPALFQSHVAEVEERLAPMGARLMPTAMHPWMDPHAELRLWPHEANHIYSTFDRIFDCRGHGWANLQSMHINLPFSGDEEFGRLHAAMRMVLPILPALAASSPFADGEAKPWLDTRLEVYRHNARRVPSVSGKVIPEQVFTREAYERELLGRVYRDLEPHDPEGVLRHEWVNARGCIARFDRMAIEIRVLDLQECPAMDIAVARAVSSLVRALAEEVPSSGATQRGFHEDALAAIFLDAVREAEAAQIEDTRYLEALGLPARAMSMREVWSELAARHFEGPEADRANLGVILEHGTLARRIKTAVGEDEEAGLVRVYRALAECLRAGRPFLPDET